MKKKGKMMRRLGWLAACIVLLLICGGFTSPLYPHYIGLDTSMFFTIGKGIVKGKVPYIELFDHKGPVFFWIYAVGCFLGGRNGVFFLQCLVLFVDLLLIEKLAGLFRAEPKSLILPFFALCFYMFEHGGLTEEFSMPLILLGIYFELKFLKSGKEQHAPGYALLYGVLIGTLAFIRLNNAVAVCGLLLGIIVVLILNNQWANLLINLVCGLAGLAVIAVPVCLYYYSRGALDDMIYGTFLHNLVYAKNSTHYPILSSSFLYFLILFIPGFYAMRVFWKKWKNGKDRTYGALLFATVLTYAMLAYTNVYLHYFMLGIPLVITAAAAEGGRPFETVRKRIVRVFTGKERFMAIKSDLAAFALTGITVIYILLAGLSACAPIYKTYLTDIARSEYDQVQDGAAIIPEEERDSVIAYNVQASYYYHADLIPCYRYFTLQRWMTTEKVNVNLEFMEYLEAEHPLWVIVPAEEGDMTIRAILDSSYTCERTDEKYSYYRYQDMN